MSNTPGRSMAPSTSQRNHAEDRSQSRDNPALPLPPNLSNRRLFMMDSSDTDGSEELVVQPALRNMVLPPVQQANRATPELHYLEKYSAELKCPLCREVMVDPMVSVECMHRFCSQCLERRMARGAEARPSAAWTHCPKCDTPLPDGRASFKRDVNFATILWKMRRQQKPLPKLSVLDAMKRDGVDFDLYSSTTIAQPPGSSSSRLSQYGGMGGTPTKRRGMSRSPAAKLFGSPSAKRFKDDPNQPSTSRPKSALSISSPPSASRMINQLGFGQQRLNGMHLTPVVLYPDGSVYRSDGRGRGQLPNCLKRPRYLYAPMDATVAHLGEYLLVRAEVEARWKEKNMVPTIKLHEIYLNLPSQSRRFLQFAVELTRVEEERQEFSLWLDKSKDTNYLPLTVPDSNSLDKGCLIVVKSSRDGNNFNIILTLKHPFDAMDGGVTVKELWDRAKSEHVGEAEERPIRLVYRFVRNE